MPTPPPDHSRDASQSLRQKTRAGTGVGQNWFGDRRVWVDWRVDH